MNERENGSRYNHDEQKMKYNGNGQRIRKEWYTNRYYGGEDRISTRGDNRYFYEGSSVLYTTSGIHTGMDKADIVYLYGGSDNIMFAEEKRDEGQISYGYTKDIRGSSRDLIDSTGQRMVRYTYSDFGETSMSGEDTVGEKSSKSI